MVTRSGKFLIALLIIGYLMLALVSAGHVHHDHGNEGPPCSLCLAVVSVLVLATVFCMPSLGDMSAGFLVSPPYAVNLTGRVNSWACRAPPSS